ncbi:MAG TPA: hypothetical protein VHG93_22075 [Longimicrobium sp.]|nr:hypothetical protein [Longimicrobium sp.]
MATQSRDDDEARLKALMDQARRLVPYGAPIVALPFIRTLLPRRRRKAEAARAAAQRPRDTRQ